MVNIRQRNLINGQKPEFGNLLHIAFIKRVERIFKGEESFHSIDWKPVFEWGRTTETNKPIFRWSDHKNGNALVDYIPCPKCQRLHCLLINFDQNGNWYDELIVIDKSTQDGFECWNCGLEMQADDDRNVFVKI